MKKSDFKQGDIITLELNDGNFFVLKNGEGANNEWIIAKGHRAGERGLQSTFSDIYSGSIYRYATLEEKLQFEACSKAGKYVPLSELNLEPVINNTYSIF